jgi:hypothetical protein
VAQAGPPATGLREGDHKVLWSKAGCARFAFYHKGLLHCKDSWSAVTSGPGLHSDARIASPLNSEPRRKPDIFYLSPTFIALLATVPNHPMKV